MHAGVLLQGCNTESVRTLLGGEELSDVNMLAHLGIIEQRSNELLQVRAALTALAAGPGATGVNSCAFTLQACCLLRLACSCFSG